MGGLPRFGEGRGTVKKTCLARPSKKIYVPNTCCGNFLCDMGDFGTFGSDLSEYRMQNVLKNVLTDS